MASFARFFYFQKSKMDAKLVKFLATTVGRDRLNRFVQYLARFLLALPRFNEQKDVKERLSKLMLAASQTRKMVGFIRADTQ